MMTTARAPRIRHADLVEGDLVCWNCRERLIAGYAGLIAEAGPVPFFGEMTLVCNKCSCANGSPGTGPAGGAAPARKGNRVGISREDNGNGP